MLAKMLLRKAASIDAVVIASQVFSTGGTITIPSDAQVGDICLIMHSGGSITTPATVTPSGFTNILNVTGSTTFVKVRAIASWKLLVSGDAGDTVSVINSTSESARLILFRRSTPITSATISPVVNAQCTNSTPTVQTVSASSGQAPLLIVAGAFGYDAMPSITTNSPALEITQTPGSPTGLIGHKLYTASPQNHTFGSSDVGDYNVLASFYFTLNSV